MLQTLINAFRVKDIRDRLFFTFLMLIVIRIGSQLPVPGVNGEVFSSWFNSYAGGFGFFDMITGGSFSSMSLFALSISPYITSSIIMQLLTIAIPALEEMQKDGEEGKKKMQNITRYVTVGLALIESSAMTYGFSNSGYLTEKGFLNALMVVIALTAGSTVLMWIGERITEKGIGNGISIILVINILSNIPSDINRLLNQFVFKKGWITGIISTIIIFAVIILLVVFVIILQGGERRIPVQYSKKVQGRKQVGGQQTHIPIKVNTAGVIPVIFAQSLLQTPIIIASLAGWDGTAKKTIGQKILYGLNQANWCNPKEPIYTIGLIIYIALIIAFAYFYTQISFNPLEIANNLKKSGGFVPGLRPGKTTSDYLAQVVNFIVFIGAIGLTIVAFLPIFFNGVFGATVSFAGTSIIIVVGVIIETVKQVESKMLERNYKGFLNL